MTDKYQSGEASYRPVKKYEDFFKAMKRVSQTTVDRQFAKGALSILNQLPAHANVADESFVERQIKFQTAQYKRDPTWETLGRIYALRAIHTETFKGMEIQVEDEV